MSDEKHRTLQHALLDSWDRNNTILVNLLRAIPEAELDARVIEGSQSIAQMFLHIHYTRLVFAREDVPELDVALPQEGWRLERDPGRIAQLLNDSAKVVREAVRRRLRMGEPMNVRYDHPVLMFQHMIWHEGYHHGQIKLVLKVAGRPLDDEAVGRVTWDIWMDKTTGVS